MAPRKIIAVVGATGAQGGGLVRAILADTSGGFAARAITRKPDSDKATELRKRGAEVVQADLDDEKSLERVFQGAHGAFCVTNFWEHFSPEKEKQQAQNMARAAKAANVKHVIWSTFEDTRKKVPLDDDRMPTLQGKYKVPHFDGKAEADQIFRELGVPTTFLLTSFYWDNFIHFGLGPKPGPDGKLAITFPMDDKKLSGIAAEDIGKVALGIFKKGEAFIGKTFGAAGEHLSGEEMADKMSKALDKEIKYNAVPADVYRGFGYPGADDMGNMFQYKRDFNDEYCGIRDVSQVKQLNPELQSFEQWLSKHKDEIPVE